MSFLDENGFDYFKLGYEEFALYPDRMISKLCTYLGIGYEPGMLSPENSSSHIIRGNSGRGDPEKRTAISYDARWMTSARAGLISFLYTPLLPYNNEIVFSNFIKNRAKSGKVNRDEFLVFSNKNKQELLRNKWGQPKNGN